MRTQFIQSGLPLYLWGELATYPALQINTSPTVALGDSTPLDIFIPHLKGHFHPVEPSRFCPFGCLAYTFDESHTKLGPTAKRLIFVGLAPSSNAARLWDRSNGRIVISSNITFDEAVFPAKHPEKGTSQA